MKIGHTNAAHQKEERPEEVPDASVVSERMTMVPTRPTNKKNNQRKRATVRQRRIAKFANRAAASEVELEEVQEQKVLLQMNKQEYVERGPEFVNVLDQMKEAQRGMISKKGSRLLRQSQIRSTKDSVSATLAARWLQGGNV